MLVGCGAQDGDNAAGSRIGPQQGNADPDPGAPAPASSAAVAAAGLELCATGDSSAVAVPEGLPDVTLPCLGAGPAVRLAALRGTPLVVNVWASWCDPCRAELPVLAQVSARAGRAVRFLGVDVMDFAPDQALGLLAASKVSFPSVVDYDRATKAALRWTGPPMTVLVRPDGTIAYRHVGELTSADQLRGLIRDHLGVTVPA